MSKYNALWEYVQKNEKESFRLTFEEIQKIAGIPIDHSFLKIQEGAYGIRLAGWENIHERPDGTLSSGWLTTFAS